MAAWHLDFGLDNVVNASNSDVIMIGDDLTGAGPLFLLETVKKTVKAHVPSGIFRYLKFELSTSTHDPAFIGVGTLVVEKDPQDPASVETLATPDGEASLATDR